MSDQHNNILELAKLATENPETEVLFFISGQLKKDQWSEYESWWAGQMIAPGLEKVFEYDCHYYLDDDEDSLRHALAYDEECDADEKCIDEIMEDMEPVEKIIVRVTL